MELRNKKVIKRSQCDTCAASGNDTARDNKVTYLNEDGSTSSFCFACRSYEKEDEPFVSPKEPIHTRSLTDDIISSISSYQSIELPERKLPQNIVEKYGVKSKIGFNGETCRYYPRYKDGTLVGYKERSLPKSFRVIGEAGDSFFGQHLFKAGGKILIITAGEEDAMSAYYMTGLLSPKKVGYASVSLPNGASSDACIKNNLEWLESYEQVIFAVDQEEEPDLRKARDYCALLSPGKGRICLFSEKDASEMLKAGKEREFYSAIWAASPILPSGIIEGPDIFNTLMEYKTYTHLPFPEEWGFDPEFTGLYTPSLTVLTAGTAVGKTTVLKRLQYHVYSSSESNIGIISMEEPISLCAVSLMGLHCKKHIKFSDVEANSPDITNSVDALFNSGRFIFCENLGIRTSDDLFSKLRFMANSRNCKYIFIDHLTALINKCPITDKISKNDYTESLVNRLNELCLELKICIILVSHVRKTEEGSSATYETGKIPTEDSIFGSSAIKQYSYFTIALSRNKLEEESPLFIHILKNRIGGIIGKSQPLFYDKKTTWLTRTSNTIEVL